MIKTFFLRIVNLKSVLNLSWLFIGIASLIPAYAQQQPFSVAEQDGRWWVIRPDGEPMVILSANHSHQLAFPQVVQRFSKHHGEDWPDRLPHKLAEDLASWGFNATAGGTATYELPFIVKSEVLATSFWQTTGFAYVDLFDEAVKEDIREKMRELAEPRDHPNLIGYALTDCPRWDIDISRRLHNKDWISFFRSLPADTAGKKRYVQFLKERYKDRLDWLNHTYRQQAMSFEDLLKSNFEGLRVYEPDVRRDDEDFLGIIARTYYQLTCGTLREIDPDRLLFGDKYKLGDHPEVVLREAAKWIDIISVQHGNGVGGQPRTLPEREFEEKYFYDQHYEELHAITGKPIWISDHQIAHPHPDFDGTQWVTAYSAEEALQLTRHFMEAAFAKPYLIGYGRCQTIDWPKPQPDGETWVKRGLYSISGEPFSKYNEGIRSLNLHILNLLGLRE